MVASLSWLSDLKLRSLKHSSPTTTDSNTCGSTKHHSHHRGSIFWNRPERPESLGILAFDTAKTMSRLVSLNRSLSDPHILRLRKEAMRTRGITYLISDDEGFLLTLACAERLEDLDRCATAVARLGGKCSDFSLNHFDQAYRDLKLGYIDTEKLIYGSKEIEKIIEKMEKLTIYTSTLYTELEATAELEASERKMNEWRNSTHFCANFDLFDQKIASQRKLVRQLKEVSLWNQSYDKAVGLMARVVFVLYARICLLFGPYISILPNTSSKNPHPDHKKQRVRSAESLKLFDDPCPRAYMSGPITSPNPRVRLVRFLSRDSCSVLAPDERVGFGVGFGIGQRFSNGGADVLPCNSFSWRHTNKVFQAAPPSTVGGSGLALRYANVILFAERYLNTEFLMGDHAREILYNMLPTSLKKYVRTKLRSVWKDMEEEGRQCGRALAEGWREAVREIMEWLVPMARDTMTWQAERNLEKQRLDTKPTVLLMQTLHYADLEKTEAAVAEVLVGLSCVYWCENRRVPSLDES